MYLLGHVGFTVLMFQVYFYLKNRIPSNLEFLAIGFGSMFPDFIDKPIGSLIFSKGRWIGHNFFFLTIVLIISLYVINENKYQNNQELIFISYIASLFHLLEDRAELSTVFFPLFGPFPVYTKTSFLLGIYSPITIITEIIGLIFLIILGLIYKKEQLYWKYLVLGTVTYLLLYITMFFLLVI